MITMPCYRLNVSLYFVISITYGMWFGDGIVALVFVNIVVRCIFIMS